MLSSKFFQSAVVAVFLVLSLVRFAFCVDLDQEWYNNKVLTQADGTYTLTYGDEGETVTMGGLYFKVEQGVTINCNGRRLQISSDHAYINCTEGGNSNPDNPPKFIDYKIIGIDCEDYAKVHYADFGTDISPSVTDVLVSFVTDCKFIGCNFYYEGDYNGGFLVSRHICNVA